MERVYDTWDDNEITLTMTKPPIVVFTHTKAALMVTAAVFVGVVLGLVACAVAGC